MTLGESLTCFEEGSAAAARFANIWLFSLPFLPPHLVLVKAKVLFYLCGSFLLGKGELGRMSMQRGGRERERERRKIAQNGVKRPSKREGGKGEKWAIKNLEETAAIHEKGKINTTSFLPPRKLRRFPLSVSHLCFPILFSFSFL